MVLLGSGGTLWFKPLSSPPPSRFLSLLSLQLPFFPAEKAPETLQLSQLRGNEFLWLESYLHALKFPFPPAPRQDDLVCPIAGSHCSGGWKASRGSFQGGGFHLVIQNSKPSPLLPTVKQERLSDLTFTFPFLRI